MAAELGRLASSEFGAAEAVGGGGSRLRGRSPSPAHPSHADSSAFGPSNDTFVGGTTGVFGTTPLTADLPGFAAARSAPGVTSLERPGGRFSPTPAAAAAARSRSLPLSPPTDLSSADDDAVTPVRAAESPAAAAAPEKAAAAGCAGYTFLAWGSLLCLVLQNSALTLTMRASRIRQSGPQLYLASSAVVTCECLKAATSAVLLLGEQGWSVREWAAVLRKDVLRDPVKANAPLLVPAGLYTLQNNLQYVAASNLDPAVFQVLYQMKLVTTALLSVIVLRRSLMWLQWSAVLLLTFGVCMVQLAGQAARPDGGARPAGSGVKAAAGTGNPAVGFVAVSVACLTSAGAGVSLEVLVKHTRPSVWVRNLQMAVFGVVMGLTVTAGKDRALVQEHGFFVGFDAVVVAVVALQSFGGLLTAVVVKHADNVIKGFATGIAIVLTALLSVVFFGTVTTPQYCGGALAVICSVFLFSLHRQIDKHLRAAGCSWHHWGLGGIVALALVAAATYSRGGFFRF